MSKSKVAQTITVSVLHNSPRHAGRLKPNASGSFPDPSRPQEGLRPLLESLTCTKDKQISRVFVFPASVARLPPVVAAIQMRFRT